MAEELEGRVQEIEKSVDTLESQVRAQIARAQSGSRAMLVIGIILIAIIFIYMTWISAKVKELSNPEDLAMILEQRVSEHVPELVEQLETELTTRASDNIEYVLDDLLKRVPGLSGRVEEAAFKLVDQFAEKLDAKADEIVKDMLAAKKKELDPLVEAAAIKGDATELKKAFKKSLEDAIGPKMDDVLVRYHGNMGVVEAHLDRLLRPDDQLSKEEKLEKEVIAAMLIFIDDAVKNQLAPAPKAP